jgi:hypothetical protein
MYVMGLSVGSELASWRHSSGGWIWLGIYERSIYHAFEGSQFWAWSGAFVVFLGIKTALMNTAVRLIFSEVPLTIFDFDEAFIISKHQATIFS